jgi:hypothetical protein
MTSLFERIFFKAVRTCQNSHPVRLKVPIRSFHQVRAIRYPATPASDASALSPENFNPPEQLESLPTSEETEVSGDDTAVPLMRGGFGVTQTCSFGLSVD